MAYRACFACNGASSVLPVQSRLHIALPSQCVELARRYLVANRGVVFDSIPMAYDIFNLKSVRRVGDGSDGLLQRFAASPNGSATPPEVGSLLIWSPYGFFAHTGHVAVVVAVEPTHIDIVEQNVEDAVWPEGQNYSRRIPVVSQTDPATGKYVSYTIVDVELDDGIDGPEPSHVLGWMTVLDELFEHDAYVNTTTAQLGNHTVPVAAQQGGSSGSWLDASKPYNQAVGNAVMVLVAKGRVRCHGLLPTLSRPSSLPVL
jgi:glutathionylspermidine amidase/synthetase